MVDGLPSRAERLVVSFGAPVVRVPCGLPISKDYFTAGVEAKGNLEQHLLGLCWLDKSFLQM